MRSHLGRWGATATVVAAMAASGCAHKQAPPQVADVDIGRLAPAEMGPVREAREQADVSRLTYQAASRSFEEYAGAAASGTGSSDAPDPPAIPPPTVDERPPPPPAAPLPDGAPPPAPAQAR